MKRRRFLLLIPVLSLVSYPVAYVVTGHREQGRARGAGEYFHYRDFPAPWEVYVFAPAAFAESRLIRMFPKAFLTNGSWADTPQRLVIRVPGESTMFWYPPFNHAGKTE